VYQTGGTIKETIELVQRHEYVLPAIQREFVWKPEQIERLFDSLMQGYPFGTFLLWRVDAENTANYKFYDFVRDYHERDNPHCPPLPKQTDRVTAVLDGQQRLTALNIGLCGSMAVKLPYKWWNNPDAFPKRHLYLDLLGSVEPTEEGDRYRFEFLTQDQVDQADPSSTCWFKVADILTMEDGPPMLEWLNERLKQDQLNAAFKALSRLHRVIHTEHLVAYYEEKSQDLTTVLNIFIRMNSGGTALSYSDLLLSIAVAQWQNRDAREEIHSLVDELNAVGEGFQFSQDLILKAGLVLTDIGNVGFKVENFNEANMKILEERWSEVREALQLAVRLFASFGYNGQNLRATSALLPVAYYLCRRAPGQKYLTTAAYAEDRQRVRTWVAKSLLKTSGIWGSGLDTLLGSLREVLREKGQERFPVDELETQMAKRGKSLQFEAEEIEEILDLEYGKGQAFSLLSLLFPFIDLQQHHHIDHVFPRSGFRRDRLRKAGVSSDQIEEYKTRRDRIANLQLLDGSANVEKQDRHPTEWLAQMHSDPQTRRHYCDQHLFGEVPEGWDGFLEFYEARRARMKAKLEALLRPTRSPATASREGAP
jgi:hypothetical protein